MIPPQDPPFTPWPTALAEHYRQAGYWRGLPFPHWLAALAERFGEATALVCGERRWSYRQLQHHADTLATGLWRLGLRPGQRVVIQLPNIAEFFALFFALLRLGVQPVVALPAHRRAEIGAFCRHAEAVAYLIPDRHAGFDYRQLAREVMAEAPSVAQVVVVGEAEEFTPFSSLPGTAAVEWPTSEAETVAFYQLSGGSTGLPKLIPRTHDDYLYSVRASAEICRLSPHTVYLCVLPVSHNFPLSSPGSLGVWERGGTVVLCNTPAPADAFALIERERVTFTALVPSLVSTWIEARSHSQHDLSSLALIQVGGAAFPVALAAQVAPTFGCRLQQVFGMAEGLVNYTRLDDPEEVILTTQGRPISADDEIAIVDDDDQPVAPGSEGHLLTRGPYTLRGYFRAASHNARAFTQHGFYRTGDRVRLTATGNLQVVGRAKDQINRGGEKVAAEEVEGHLLYHPAVADVAIVAMPDPYLGERSCAFVVPGSAPLPRRHEVARYLRERGLAEYKIPDRIEAIASLPLTAVGKVDKAALRRLLDPAPIAAATHGSPLANPRSYPSP